MVDTATLMVFISVSILLILAPGPDLIFTITQGMTNGKKAGIATALGLSLGNIVHTLAAVLGLSIMMKTSTVAFTLFKILGAAYLFYLAYQAIKHRKEPIHIHSGNVVHSNEKLFFRGFLMNILNPKVAIFFLTFLPQFVDYGAGTVALQMTTLGLIFILLTAVIFGLFGYFSGTVRERLVQKPYFSEIMNVAAAGIFIALGVKLMATRM
jgi:threonine/homoserine/homoserine lactone efflux protein